MSHKLWIIVYDLQPIKEKTEWYHIVDKMSPQAYKSRVSNIGDHFND